MSASPRTAQPTLGIYPLGAALVAIAMAVVLVAVVAGQLTTTKSPTAPAAAPAPAQWDHGTSSLGLSNATAGQAAAQWDHGTSSIESNRFGSSIGSGVTRYSRYMR